MMILCKRENNPEQKYLFRLSTEPYLIINLILAGLILLVLIYSGVYSPEKDNYPVTCIHEKMTGQSCVSCGLSHSFSLILRGRFIESYRWNIYGMQVFLFFASQLILRLAFSKYYISYPGTHKQLIVIDCIGAGIMFLITFRPFIANIAASLMAN